MCKLWRDETGTTTVEYALLLSVVVMATFAAWATLGEAIQHSVSASVDTISAGQTSTAGIP
ncbi:MAG TPA: Flp family type IVb pilin [Armatimonadetes bacterium]|nr:Flp family type IVb pilin [Armatimonadota bacterium]